MIRRYLVLLIVLSFIFQSCEKKTQNLLFALNMQPGPVYFTIPPTSDTSASLSYGSVYLIYNVDSFVRANTAQQLGINNITGVTLSSCVLTIQNPGATNNFQNFETCYATFATDANPAPYIVTISNPDIYTASLTTPADTVTELKSYFTNGQFRYAFGGKLRRATTLTLNCTVQFLFIVNVNG